jgi:hypothetical protein
MWVVGAEVKLHADHSKRGNASTLAGAVRRADDASQALARRHPPAAGQEASLAVGRHAVGQSETSEIEVLVVRLQVREADMILSGRAGVAARRLAVPL